MAKVHGPPTVLALRIRGARIKQGLNQSQLAELVGVQQSTISAWERGKRYNNRTEIGFNRLIDLLEIEHTPEKNHLAKKRQSLYQSRFASHSQRRRMSSPIAHARSCIHWTISKKT